MQEYREEVKADLLEHIKENAETYKNLSIEEYRDLLLDYRETDSITGNGSGSYYFNSFMARETIDARGLLWDEDFNGWLDEMGVKLSDIIEKGPEAVDVWARCMALEMLSDDELEEIRAEALGGKDEK